MNELLEINSGGTAIIISGNKKLIDSLSKDDFLYEYIPCVATRIVESGVVDFYFDNKNEFTEFDLPLPGEGIISCGDLSNRDIISLIELLLERKRQENQIDCLHSSCSIYNGKAVVFFGGASGMGKTRLMMELGLRFNASCYSDEKTLINLIDNNVLGGVGVAQISKPPMQQKLGLSKIKLDVDNNIYPLGLLVHAYVEDRIGVDYEFWDKDKAEWHIYEELTRKIRANSRRVKNGKFPVNGLDSSLLAKDRITRIESWIELNKILYIRGGANDIINKIIELID